MNVKMIRSRTYLDDTPSTPARAHDIVFVGKIIIMQQTLSVVTEVMIVDNIGQSHDGGVQGNVLVNHEDTVLIRCSIRKIVTSTPSCDIAENINEVVGIL